MVRDITRDYARLAKSLETFIRCGLAGAVYTQTTDVEVEVNGYLTYDRKVFKFDKNEIRRCHDSVVAAAKVAAVDAALTVY